MDRPQLELLALKGVDEIGRWSLAPGLFTLGRSPDCSISLEGDGVADQHAELSVNDDGTIDLQVGLAGVSVEGSSVSGAVRVRPDQYIDLGSISILIQAREVSRNVSVTAEEQDELPSEFRQPERYEIGAEIAKGGMGAVLNARQSTIRRAVAMKVILGQAEEDPRQRLRFIEEAQITGQLEHPNIVPVHDAGIDGSGRVYYTMKLVKGITLKKVLELLKKGEAGVATKYSLLALLTIYQKVCDAVAFAHSKGVIHRDLKPENIMIGAYGEVLVMDWGLAKIIRKDAAPRVGAPAAAPRLGGEEVASARFDQGEDYATMAGSIMGTPAYMAPEQARGDLEQLDERTDIFALGVILYLILTLSRPFTGKNSQEMLDRIRTGAPVIPPVSFLAKGDEKAGRPRLPHLNTGAVPDSLSAVTMRALEHLPERRYQKVEALQADLTAYQNGFATTAEKAGAWKQVKLLIRRHKAASLGILAVLLTGVGFGSKVVVEKNRAEREKVHAEAESRRANAALADLKKTAPALRELADSEAGFTRFKSAMEKLDAAIALDPEYLPSYWRRAWLFVGMERWADAIAAVDVASRTDSKNASLAAIRSTLEIFKEKSDSATWTNEQAEGLRAHLTAVGAKGEVIALSTKLRLNSESKLKLVNARLKEWLGESRFAGITPDGRLYLNLSGTTITTLQPLEGLPIELLSFDTDVESLAPLRGMRLKEIGMANCTISDLSPLKGMLLESFSASRCEFSDLAPLAGMPLRSVKLTITKVNDLTPLRGAPIHVFQSSNLGTSNFEPLRGAPLESFKVWGSPVDSAEFLRESPIEELILPTSVSDLAFLKGKPLRILNTNLSNCPDISPLRDAPIVDLDIKGFKGDFTPLLSLKRLERLAIDAPGAFQAPRTFEALRNHPTLKSIAIGFNPYVPVAQFWADYDVKQAVKK